MKQILWHALLILLIVPWPAAAAFAEVRPAIVQGKVLIAGLAPDTVPAFPSTASPSGGTDRNGNRPPAETPAIQQEARRYVDEALPVLSPSWAKREKYWSDPGRAASHQGEGSNGAAWNELYFRNFRLSLSTMPDEETHLKYLVPGQKEESQRWERFQTLQDRLRTGSYREAAESLGVVVEPRIRLGIEF
ncbi:MAG: hypothetical protein CVU61_11615 [Deltaproteobacteria bacterium HGW-Deltaproteobacteria-19]|jgi:hypothetical protein|nr:MAG: hypothetical protein CVU61_11615 [Deltaproteobacteria bacterium HGW-Deltaproteobacteria-19]